MGEVIGGIHSFVRGLIKFAPEDIHYTVFGATTDAVARPVAKYSECSLGDKPFSFFPLYRLKHGTKQSRLPTTVRYEMAARVRLPGLSSIDILESHRIEHLALRGSRKVKNIFLHQNMEILRDENSDIRWRHIPSLYYALEKSVLRNIDSVFCVREDAARQYKSKYPEIASRIRFLPTWMDPDVFHPRGPDVNHKARQSIIREFGLDASTTIMVAVGRLDVQKAPQLMIDAVASLFNRGRNVSLIWIGDGVLRKSAMSQIERHALGGRVILAGMRSASYIANKFHGSDLFVMSSAYEGMPIAMLEALACGLPVVSTRVGEVGRLVTPGVNGELCNPGNPMELASAMDRAIPRLAGFKGQPCISVAEKFQPNRVLAPVYESYRQLAGG